MAAVPDAVSTLENRMGDCNEHAMLLAATIQDDTLTVNATIIHVFGLALTGEFAAAEKALAAIDHLVAADYPEYRALKNIVRMDLSLSTGDLDRAQRGVLQRDGARRQQREP